MEIFKKCSNCRYEWIERTEFLGDSSLSLVGYQVNFGHLKEGLFLFNHSCGTTLAIPAGEFADLYNGPIFTGRQDNTSACPNYCLSENELRPCPAACECAFVREVTDILSKKEVPVTAAKSSPPSR